MKNRFKKRIRVLPVLGGCGMLFWITGCGLFGGGDSSEKTVEPPPEDPEFNLMISRATDHAVNGRYNLAENLYDQALRRAMRIDLRQQICRVALTLAAFTLDREDVAAARSYLALLKDIKIDGRDASLRAADLQFRLARLARDPDADDLRNQLGKKIKEFSSEAKINVYKIDAELTVMEDLIDQGKSVPVLDLLQMTGNQFPRSVFLRARICNARVNKDSKAWIEAARDYSRMGNVAAAFREASRCARAFQSIEAAQFAARLAEAERNEEWMKKAQAIRKEIEKRDSKK